MGKLAFQPYEDSSRSAYAHSRYSTFQHARVQYVKIAPNFASAGKAERAEHISKHPYFSMTQYVLIIHEVADYPAWKAVFDSAAGIRKEAGERSYQVLKYDTDANKIVHFSAWTSIADAKAFFESPRLAKIRLEAGVKAPEFIYLDLLEAGKL